MKAHTEVELIVKQLYAMAYEITTWMKFESPTVSRFQFQVDIDYDGAKRELQILRDESSTITFTLFPDSIKQSIERGRHLVSNVPRDPLYTLVLDSPADDQGIPRVSVTSQTDTMFPVLTVRDLLQYWMKEAHRYHA